MKIFNIVTDGTVVRTAGDMLDIMGNAHAIILCQENLASEFFDLKTGLAGEILQKFSTYDKHLRLFGRQKQRFERLDLRMQCEFFLLVTVDI